MKILHVLDHSIPLHSGYTFRTRAILEQQRELGWETVHVTSAKHVAPSGEEEVVDGFHFYRTSPANGLVARMPIVNQLAVVTGLEQRLDEVIRRERPQIIHAHSPSLNGMAALRAGRKHGLPVVYECRAFWEDAAVDHGTSREGGLRYRLTRGMESRVFHEADAVTTICEGLKQDIVSRGVMEEKVTVIPNAVDLERFSLSEAANGELARRLGLEDKLVLGFIGSFYAYEGLGLLIQAMAGILPKVPEARLLLVGGGPEEKALKQQVASMGLADKVIFTGRVPHDEVAGYYRLVDLLVYPRLSMRLTDLVTPLKPLEAMAQGKLVIASDVGGHRELVVDGRTGRLFRAGDRDSLIRTVLDLAKRREEWDSLQQAGRRYVEEERNWPASVARYKLVYARVYAQKPVPPVAVEET
ncbi:MAG TPA: glycosyltransferase, exosortase A system-associated [Chromatiaceae bacterium]|nr:glycosyltransferase, exosortase A system-associated [Chromatiaceae bacterium]